MAELSWIARARKYLGQREIPGAKHNPLIVEWWKAVKAAFRDDETPWCGAFVGGVLATNGNDISAVKNPASARAWLNLPKRLDSPAYGCVVIFWRGSPSGGNGHVGFVVGRDRAGNLMVLGGNQGDMVNVKPFSTSRVLGYRWPGFEDRPLPHRYDLPLLESDGRLSTNEA